MEKPDQNSVGASAEFKVPELQAELLTASEKLDLDALHDFLAGLDQWAEEIRQQADADSESVEQIYYSRLPEALFHATTKGKAKQIKAEGLKPSTLQFEDNEVVSLSDSIGYAKFCASQTQGVAPEELVILEVTTQGLDREEAKSYLQMDNPYVKGEKLHEVHYGKAVNPDWIHELSPAEAAEIELTENA